MPNQPNTEDGNELSKAIKKAFTDNDMTEDGCSDYEDIELFDTKQVVDDIIVYIQSNYILKSDVEKIESIVFEKYGIKKPFIVRDIVGQYTILERLGRPSNSAHNAKFRVKCGKCNGILFRYANKLLKGHRFCSTTKENLEVVDNLRLKESSK